MTFLASGPQPRSPTSTPTGGRSECLNSIGQVRSRPRWTTWAPLGAPAHSSLLGRAFVAHQLRLGAPAELSGHWQHASGARSACEPLHGSLAGGGPTRKAARVGSR